MKKTAKQSGFTIIELIFATLIFSLVMVVVLVASFQISRIYYKGVSISSTDESARTTIDDISDDVRFAQVAQFPVPLSRTAPGEQYFCIGLHRYSYVLFKKVTNADINNNQPTGIRQDRVGYGCPSPGNTPVANPIQLLGPDMQLNAFDFSCAKAGCNIHVHIVFYGADNKVFSSADPSYVSDPNQASYNADKAPDAGCSGNLLSSQFCAAIDLQTKVLQRL